MKNKIIAIHGLIGAGKDTVLAFIKMHLFLYDKSSTNPTYTVSQKENLLNYAIENVNNSTWLLDQLPDIKIDRFAAPLKAIIASFMGIQPDDLISQSSKKIELDPSVWYSQTKSILTPRDLHTDISDAIKQSLNNDIFATTCIERCNNSNADLVIINDLRFENELDVLLKAGAYLVKVQRPSAEREQRKTLEDKGIIHLSEYGLQNDAFNYNIRNDSTYHDLSIKVLDMLLDAGLVTNQYVKQYKNL